MGSSAGGVSCNLGLHSLQAPGLGAAPRVAGRTPFACHRSASSSVNTRGQKLHVAQDAASTEENIQKHIRSTLGPLGLQQGAWNPAATISNFPGSMQHTKHQHQHQQPKHGRSAQQAQQQELNVDQQALLQQLVDGMLGSSSQVWGEQQSTTASSISIPADLLHNTQQYAPYDVARTVGDLAKHGQFAAALKLIEEISRLNRVDVLQIISKRYFMQYAQKHRASKEALQFLHTLPKRFHDVRLYNMVLQVCAASHDLETGLAAVELADKFRFKVDVKLLTSLIKVCKSVGNADKAFKIFTEVKARNMPLDGHIIGAVIGSFAEAMQREMTVVHERKEQFVLIERAFQIIQEAEAAGLVLETPPWNSLLACCGRCGQLKRAFEVLDMMMARGIAPNVITYGSLLEACVQAKRQDMALGVFKKALKEGFHYHIEIYTQAISACKIEGTVNLEKAFEIYNIMQRNGVEPDKKFYGALIAVAGQAGRLDLAVSILNDMVPEGLQPASTICSALVYACLNNGSIELARQVYDLFAKKGVYPVISQFNRMMDWYAVERRFGDVVSLLSDMRRARLQPNLNTYRIVLNACQRSDQAQLMFEIYSVMKIKKVPILQQKFAQTIYYSLIKACFNQVRMWSFGGFKNKLPPWANQAQSVRIAEGEAVLQALGAPACTLAKSPFSVPPESVNWVQQAIYAYRDMVAAGHKPSLDVMDRLLGCLRLKLQPAGNWSPMDGWMEGRHLPGPHLNGQHINGQHPASMHHLSPYGSTNEWDSGAIPAAQQPQQARTPLQKYETTFDKRAIQILEDAISRGLLPPFKVDGDVTMDLRHVPPTLAEVYVLAMLSQLERRAARSNTPSGSISTNNFFHNITILVPPFNPDYINWPSYIEKLNRHYNEKDALGTSLRHGSWSEEEASSTESDREPDEREMRLELPNATTSTTEQPAIDVLAAASTSADVKEESDTDTRPLPPAYDTYGGNSAGSSNAAAAASTSSRASTNSSNDADSSASTSNATTTSSSGGSSSSGGGGNSTAWEQLSYPADDTTGLAAAATCRRMKCFASLRPAKGMIVLGSKTILSWIINKKNYEAKQQQQQQQQQQAQAQAQADTALLNRMGLPTFIPSQALLDQQRSIRLGMSPGTMPGQPRQATPHSTAQQHPPHQHQHQHQRHQQQATTADAAASSTAASTNGSHGAMAHKGHESPSHGTPQAGNLGQDVAASPGTAVGDANVLTSTPLHEPPVRPNTTT